MGVYNFILALAISSTFVTANAGTLQAHFGNRVSVWVMPDQGLTVRYNEMGPGRLRLCDNSLKPQGRVSVIFITGPEYNRQVIKKSLKITCTTGYPGNPNHAIFFFHKDEEPELWNSLFPPNKNLERWYALQMAFLLEVPGSRVAWDSNLGQNYRLILE